MIIYMSEVRCGCVAVLVCLLYYLKCVFCIAVGFIHPLEYMMFATPDAVVPL